ncbi:MAG: secretion system protein E, partial [Gammaproteobacteria bacterium]|nr:secretion system protein E [Gammaproteobacteria bacterium]
MTAAHKPRLIGEILVDKGLVSQDQVNIALTEQKKTNQHLGKILVRLGFATEAVIRDLLGGVLGQVSIELS